MVLLSSLSKREAVQKHHDSKAVAFALESADLHPTCRGLCSSDGQKHEVPGCLREKVRRLRVWQVVKKCRWQFSAKACEEPEWQDLSLMAGK